MSRDPSLRSEAPEDILRAAGATHAHVDFGGDAFVTFRFASDGEADEGWDVIDNRRRYPSQVASSLTFRDAVRFAKNVSKMPRPL